MRVGLVVYGDLTDVSGGNLYDRVLVEALERGGHRVELFSLPRSRYAAHVLHNWTRPLGRALEAAPIDVLVQDELAHPSLFRFNRWLRKRRPELPLVSIVHHLRSSEERPEWQNRLYRAVEVRYLRTIDRFVFNSETTRESVERLLGQQPRGIVATPGGDRLRGLAPRTSPDDVVARAGVGGPLRVLFVGNLIRRKGLHDLVEALGSLRADRWELDVVGSREVSPAYAEDLRRRTIELGLSERVVFHGELSDAELVEQYRRAHVLAVPSSYEGFGMVYLEALGFGLPVIASAAGAAHEVVSHEQTGYLVLPGDVESLGRHLHYLGAQRRQLARMGIAALERFAEQATWADTTSRIESFLAETANAG